jgi:hypothetical protein
LSAYYISSNAEVREPLFLPSDTSLSGSITLLLVEDMRSGAESQGKFDISGRALGED